MNSSTNVAVQPGDRRLRPMPELHHEFTKPERERIMRLVKLLERTERKLETLEKERGQSAEPNRVVGMESFLIADRGALRWALAILTGDHALPMGDLVKMARRVRQGLPVKRGA